MSGPLLHEQEALPAAPPLSYGNSLQPGELLEDAPAGLPPEPAGASRVQLVELFGGGFYRASCELCGRSLGLTAVNGGTGLCGSCRATLRTLRRSRVMATGRRVARLLAYSGTLAAELVHYRAGEAALGGRLPAEIASAAGVPTPARFICSVCGVGCTSRTAAVECCAADHPSMEAHDMTDQNRTIAADQNRLEEAAAWDEEFDAGARLVEEVFGDVELEGDDQEAPEDFDSEYAAGADLVERITTGRPRADGEEGDLS